MFSATSFSTRDGLRRSKSTRSIRKFRRAPELESVNRDLAKSQATAAASHAMRLSSERSSTDSRNSYDRLGGPGSVAVPRRRPGSSLRSTEDNLSIAQASLADPSTPRQSLENVHGQSHYLDDPAALPPITEFNGLDGRNSSLPSSYRRLRKAKSMFSTRTRASKLPGDSWHVDPANVDQSPELTMPRTLRHSISFFRGNHEPSRTVRSATSQDATQLARHQFLQGTNETGPQLRRSSFLLSRHKKEHKPFRKTLRASSETGITASCSSEQSRPRRKSRSFSVSIKNGIKRVFGLSKATEEPVPPQEIAVSQGDSDQAGVETDNSDACQSNNMNYCLDTNLGRAITSSPSRDSLCTSNSRVTSWADSTAVNTITTRRTGHRKSLSLIEEHEDLNQQLPQTVAISNMGHPTVLDKKQSRGRSNGAVDSRDLYEALMEQISRNTLQSTDEEVVFGTVREHRAIPECTSPAFSKRSRCTIRHVPSEESFTSPTSFVTARGRDSLTPQRHYTRPMPSMMSVRIPQRLTGQENSQPIGFSTFRQSPHATYVVGEESDQDSGSVIVARSGEQKIDDVSPSVYSRTTSGDSPSKSCQDDALANGEPGTATIFASQRTTYSSPKRTTGSTSMTQVQPSADWQKWMSSQIERIEKATPTRAHVREDAQFLDDDELFTNMLRRGPRPSPVSDDVPNEFGAHETSTKPPLSEYKVLTTSNFSRPFSRSSSLRTLVSFKKLETEVSDTSPFKPLHAENESSPESKGPSGSSPFNNQRILSPVRSRSRNLPLLPESPTPKRTGPGAQKRKLTQEQYRRYSARRAPIVSDGKAGRFRSLQTRREYRGQENENVKQQDEHSDLMESYHKLQDVNSTISSKHMVEMFLDSRRQQMGTQMSDDGAEEAFL